MSNLNPAIAGVDFTDTSTIGKFTQGTRAYDTAGIEYVYVKATAALTQYLAYLLLPDFTVATGITTTAASTAGAGAVCWPQQSGGIASGSFGWVAVSGPLTLTVAASCAAASKLYTTATTGVLDDAVTTLVNGVKINTTVGGAQTSAAGNVFARAAFF